MVKKRKKEEPVTLYLGSHIGIWASLKGTEIVSRTVDIENICGNLYSFYVTLIFKNISSLVSEKDEKGSDGFLKSYATPSNLELTLGKRS